jgi:hypothetical protein
MADMDSKETAQRVFTPYQGWREAVDHVDVPGNVLMRFAEKVESIASGSSVILQIAEANAIDRDFCDDGGPSPYFNDAHMSVMLKLVQTSIDMLSSEAENIKEWAYKQRTVGGAIAAYEQAAFSLKCKGIPIPDIN